MNLLFIVLFITLISVLLKFVPKLSKIVIPLSVLLIISFYFLLTYNCKKDYFFPDKYSDTDPYKYNLLVNSLKNGNLFLYEINNFDNEAVDYLHKNDVYQNYFQYFNKNLQVKKVFDLSYYKDKIYLYFGLTPVLLFYLPFNLLSGYCLSDNIIAFCLVSLIFIFSLLILKLFNKEFLHYDIKPHFLFLTTILVGFCNYVMILAIKAEIYEICSLSATVLLLVAVYLFIKNISINDKTKNNVLIFCIGLLLSLTVGARPHYVLFIPVVFFFVIYAEHSKGKNIKEILFSATYFLVPCIIYGTVLALYNYYRFDSIFEFGWKYQLNSHNQYEYIATIKDFLIGLKYHLYQLPENIKNNYTIFSFSMGKEHRIANEFSVGLIYVCPLSMFLLFTPLILKKTNKNIITIFVLLFSLFFINFNIACFFGAMRRYAFEYIYILTILYFLSFFILDKNILNEKHRNLFFVLFILISVYMLYLHFCLLFCIHNSLMFIDKNNVDFYTKLINFLFNGNIPDNFLLNKLENLVFLENLH
ncbi:MAG: hypothetical protein J6U02_04255 [Elusimicrobia bacterium]|nr:hypothetical protein [Elusimicrobiota bacterium]